MNKRVEDGPKDPNGRPLMVFGEVSVEAYQGMLEGKFRQVNILPLSPETVAELRSLPGSRLELQPRQTVPGIIDLVPTVYDPTLRNVVFRNKHHHVVGEV